jgi:flagellar hook-associated protein 3 FlgL
MLRRHNVQLRQDVNRLSQEVTTGLAANLAKHLTGDFTYLSEIERNLTVLKSHRTSALEAGLFTAGMQNALEQIQNISSSLAPNLLTSAESGLAAHQPAVARAAIDALEQNVNALNVQVAGRNLFSGNATNQVSLISASSIVTELRAAIGSETSASNIQTLVDDWFNSPAGGFNTIAYRGSETALSPYRLGQAGQVDLDLRANSPVLRDVLKFTALAVLASDSSLDLSDETRADLQKKSGQGLYQSQDSLTGLRSELGYAEAKVEEGKVRLASERMSLELTRNAFISVDPFESATMLENAQTQLESLYAVTVRMSRLSLAGFLR